MGSKVRFTFTVEEGDLDPNAMGRDVPEVDDFAAWNDIIGEGFGVNVSVESIGPAEKQS